MVYFYSMKTIIFITGCLLGNLLNAQNVQKLFNEFPSYYLNCNEAFQSAVLEWSEERLDNDSIFRRVTSWAPGGQVKNYSDRLDRLQGYIERASENNSFSLNAPPEIGKEVMQSLEALHVLQKQIIDQWNAKRNGIVDVNVDFVVPNELDNSCEQITEMMNKLEKVSQNINQSYQSFLQSIQESLQKFQMDYDALAKIKHPMVNNQCLDELSGLGSILVELVNGMNFHYKNMVESRMAWNNAICK